MSKQAENILSIIGLSLNLLGSLYLSYEILDRKDANRPGGFLRELGLVLGFGIVGATVSGILGGGPSFLLLQHDAGLGLASGISLSSAVGIPLGFVAGQKIPQPLATQKKSNRWLPIIIVSLCGLGLGILIWLPDLLSPSDKFLFGHSFLQGITGGIFCTPFLGFQLGSQQRKFITQLAKSRKGFEFDYQALTLGWIFLISTGISVTVLEFLIHALNLFQAVLVAGIGGVLIGFSFGMGLGFIPPISHFANKVLNGKELGFIGAYLLVFGFYRTTGHSSC